MAPLWIGASPNSCGGATTPQDRALHGRFAWCDLGLNRRSGGRRRGGDRIRGVHGLCKSPAATPENRDATIHANVLCFMQTRTKLQTHLWNFLYLYETFFLHAHRVNETQLSRQPCAVEKPRGPVPRPPHRDTTQCACTVHTPCTCTDFYSKSNRTDGVLCVSTHAYACPGRSRRSFLQTTELSILFCR